MIRNRTGITVSAGQLHSLLSSLLKQGTKHAAQNDALKSSLSAAPEHYDLVTAKNAGGYPGLAAYHLYVASGGGYMCDDDKRFLIPVFDRLAAAVANGVPTVMVSQGVGPLDDPELVARAKQVLPFVDFIMIREERVARPILDAIGVPRDKVLMTGDDAIELAYNAHKKELGQGIGLSLRIAHYTAVDEEHVNRIRPVLHRVASRFRAELVAAPIDVNEADMTYIEAVMKGYSKVSKNWRKYEFPEDIIRRVGRCRVMVSGTFHGAVFALGQGIPVVALSKSVYQTIKAAGLAAEFGESGCQVIDVSDVNLEKRLEEALNFAWSSAVDLRPRLMRNAKRQIDLGNDAYTKIFDMVEGNSGISTGGASNY
ncbi:MAG: hypothetical protein BroJett021_43140 [Chloroflexota bacterium]|nr:MAG: hypothetical protein BroJett021_43140 [Chloroflexota bacterium]